MKKVFAILSLSLFLTAVCAPVSVMAQEPAKTECTKKCDKDTKKCDKDTKKCDKNAKKCDNKCSKKKSAKK